MTACAAPLETCDRLNALSERVAKLEALRESESDGQKVMAQQLVLLTREIQTLAIKINTVETQRNTVIGVAGLAGAAVVTGIQTVVGWFNTR